MVSSLCLEKRKKEKAYNNHIMYMFDAPPKKKNTCLEKSKPSSPYRLGICFSRSSGGVTTDGSSATGCGGLYA
jgi:hypothetical protein